MTKTENKVHVRYFHGALLSLRRGTHAGYNLTRQFYMQMRQGMCKQKPKAKSV